MPMEAPEAMESNKRSRKQGPQRLGVALKSLLGEAWALVLDQERERSARRRIPVGVSRHEMSVQVGNHVAQRLVVHLQRPVVALERLGDAQHLKPVGRRLVRIKLGRFDHMPTTPHDDRVPRCALARCR